MTEGRQVPKSVAEIRATKPYQRDYEALIDCMVKFMIRWERSAPVWEQIVNQARMELRMKEVGG